MVDIKCGDCLDIMKQIKDNSIDLVLCDLPYGTTACSWDIVIPFDKLWEQYNRILKDTGTVILFGSQPFTTNIIASNLDNFRYDNGSLIEYFDNIEYEESNDTANIRFLMEKKGNE